MAPLRRRNRTASRGIRRKGLIAAIAAVALLASACADDNGDDAGARGEDGPFRISLVQSYTGNDWQNASANLIRAIAATPPYDELVEFRHDIAGPDAEAQTSMMAEHIAAGVDALVIYPINPEALNPVIREACDLGIVVVAYDSWVTEDCAYNVHPTVDAEISDETMGALRMHWLAEELGGEGKIAEIIGVAGTTFDSMHQAAVDAALEEYPDIELVAREEGFWSQPAARDAIRSIIAAHPDLDGFIAQVGCWGATQALMDEGFDPLPCAGDTANGHLKMMLSPEEIGPEGINLPSIGVSETTFSGGLAFMQAVKILQGEDRCQRTMIDNIVLHTEDLVVGDDPTNSANVYPREHVPTVPDGFFVNFYSPQIGQGINASLAGIPDVLHEPEPPADVRDGLTGEPGCLVP